MNPFLVALLSMLVRQAFLTLAGALGLAHLVQPIVDQYMTEFQQMSVAIAFGILAVGFAAWRKFKDRQKLMTALSSMPITEAMTEAVIREGAGVPSVTTPKDQVPS
jgi:hypothetical protein